MLVSAKSDVGLVRPVNEDSYLFVMPNLFVVADGMGGHVAGEIASKLAVDTVVACITGDRSHTPPPALLNQAITDANRAVYNASQAGSQYAGMGTTVTAVYIDKDKVYWGHVGDSRLYLLHAEDLRQLTNDHSLVSELIRTGSITEDEARCHPQRNILTRAVGAADKVQVEVGQTNWQPGDSLLLCTDGLTNMLDESQVLEIISLRSSIDSRLDQLIDSAKKAGGLDNITAILLQYEE